MQNNVIFNITVCILGILIFLVHIINFIFKRNKRKDEKALFLFIAFTAFHFAIYLLYTFIHIKYTSDNFVKSFYKLFYIMNNLEVFFLFLYMLTYVRLKKDTKRILLIANLLLFSLMIIMDFLNIFTGIFFHAEDGVYIRSKTMIISQVYQFIMLTIVFFITIFNNKLNKREKAAFGIYCILPLVAILVQNRFKGYAIAYASIIIAVEILFFFINVEKNIELAREEEKNREAQIKLMLSQIQPHFIYNSLSSISTLIDINPARAQKALDDFTDYLRMNLASITETKLISFENELKHIKTYVELEKIRFGDRVNVIYDIGTTDFNVSPLSIQPIVENAIKHGILKKIDGGTVHIKTYENDTAYCIEVEDNGVGFNIKDLNYFNNKHFGINNIKYRIDKSNGKFEIDSVINEGTKVKVTINK